MFRYEQVVGRFSLMSALSPSGDADFFPGGPLPELIILKSPICACYIHASLRNPGKKFWLNIFHNYFCVHMSSNRTIIFMGGEFPRTYEIPSKFALIKYVLKCASDVGCCMKHAKSMGDSQKTIRFLLAHTCAFVVWAYCLLTRQFFFHGWIHFTMNGCAHAVG